MTSCYWIVSRETLPYPNGSNVKEISIIYTNYDSLIAKINERGIGFLARILRVVCRVYTASTRLGCIYREQVD